MLRDTGGSVPHFGASVNSVDAQRCHAGAVERRGLWRITAVVTLVVCALLVIYAEGVQWIALWNLLPLVLAGLVVLRGTGVGRTSWSAIAFTGVATLAIAVIHTAWVFDWGGTETGSSTAGLIFLFSPIYSILLGTFGWAVVKAVERIAGKGKAAAWRS